MSWPERRLKGIKYAEVAETTTRMIVYEPGDGGRYEFVVTNLCSLSNRSRETFGLSTTAYLITWLNNPGRPSILLNYGGGILMASYVREKLVGVDEPTSILFAQLFAFLLDRQPES